MFSVGLGGHLFGMDLDTARSGMLHVVERFCHLLVNSRHDLMQSELQLTDKVMSREVLEVFVIVAVEDLDFEPLLLLKVEINSDLGDPLRIKVVIYDLGLSDLLPHITGLPEEDAERITLGESVHIYKLFA